MAFLPTQANTPPPPLDRKLPLPPEAKQLTTEVSDHENASSSTPAVGQTTDDDRGQHENASSATPAAVQTTDDDQVQHENASSPTPIVGQTTDDDRLQQNNNNRQPNWLKLTVGFCLAAGAEMAGQRHKTDAVSFYLLCMLLLLAFSAIFVATNIPNKHAHVARVLEHVGAFLGSTAFILAITIAFPLWLKVVSWAIYALAVLAIFICNYRQLTLLSPSPVSRC